MIRLERPKVLLCAALISAAAAWPIEAAVRVRIKLATLAPEGSTWMNNFRKMTKEIRDKTNGTVRFKAYPGGVQGDERDVLRKIRIGQLHGGGFTGVGIGAICPDTLVVAVPMLVRDYGEIDHIKQKLGHHFLKGIEDSGFVLLGWQEVGFVYLMSLDPITRMEGLRSAKIWSWEGDPVAPTVFRAAAINPVHLALQDVLPALQTGMIDCAYSSPLGAVVLQWHTKIRYLTDCPLTYALSGVVVTKKVFNKIRPEYRSLVLDTCRRYLETQIVETREANDDAIRVLQKHGVKVVSFTPEGRRELQDVFLKAGEQLTGKAFSAEIFEKTTALLKEYRAAGKDQQ